MKRFVVYIMLLLVLGDVFPLSQFFKFPVLWSHYVEHKVLNPHISFTDFLSMHYWGDDLNDQDDDQDMRLPFKKLDFHMHNLVCVPYVRTFNYQNSIIPVAKNYPKFQSDAYFDPALTSLFRPPRA